MNKEGMPVNQFAMIWNYNARVEHQHNYFGSMKEDIADTGNYELVDLRFFSMKHFGSVEGQGKLRQALEKAAPKMNVDSGRDWVAVYMAYHYFANELKLKKRYVDFFSDVEHLLPGALNKVKMEELGDRRYKTYTEALSKECDKWFIEDGSLPPMNEWTTQKYKYNVDPERRRSIQQLARDIYQALNS